MPILFCRFDVMAYQKLCSLLAAQPRVFWLKEPGLKDGEQQGM